jgi:hypothetical protein
MVLKFFSRFSSVDLRHVSVTVARVTRGSRLFLHLAENFWTRLLEELAVRVVILVRDTILFHNVIICKLG